MSSFLRCLGCLLVPLCLIVLLIVGLIGILVVHFAPSGGGASSPQGDNAVTLRARAMAAHLNNSCLGQTRTV